jgi:Peptidase family M28/PA domain
MRKLSLLLAASLVCAQPPARLAPGYDSFRPATLKADLTFLSSEALDGRLSLARGSEVAIQWIASEFAKAGLKPLAGDSFLQPVPLIEYTPDRSLTTLAIARQGQPVETFRAPDAASNFANDSAVSGEVVFAGYGITAPELNYDDYAGIRARGKIVLLFNHEPQENDAASVFNGIGNTRYANNNYKLFNAQRHGAIAVLTMPDPNHQGPQRRVTAATARLAPQALSDGGPAVPLFTVGPRVSDALFAAAGKHPAEVQSAIDAKASPASFEIPGVRVDLQTATATRRRGTSYNVAGLIEGSDPTLQEETIVFSGHFDHDGSGPAGVFHGADDNGSGTVGVVALAHAFAANPVKPKRSLLFIVFAAEERGLLGSYYYVSHPLRTLSTTRAQINFDMIGRNEAADPRVITNISPDTTNQLGLIGTDYSPDYRETVERQNKTVGLNLTYKWDLDAYNGILFRSDQYPFLLHDVPAIWWFTGFHPDYHQVSDTVEKINFEKMAKILKLAYLSGFEFADEAHTPRLEPRAKTK